MNEHGPSRTLQQRVLDALRDTGAAGSTIWLLAQDTGLSESQVRAALARLHARRLAFCFERDEGGWGRWEAAGWNPD